ncbi:dipeptide ABC transporter ATP-binding protein [Persicimonas caeni]|uniref:Dipeptide ABC transporter ATP-binding protein n=1 Tax=Persicimonas caeni TaxID=2292766 RepID=A0A4Y6Q283_PERCE|nr:dipeptide ABC transporter ATP-binding protein [Persicimonas caeni]QDG54550.1 dipeptide ABC transporter ATP-binding protein [Persicimonas caeni]QED35771.1 dipeptide ABC transporter ATP-binding protein [Persicimonas caeni]
MSEAVADPKEKTDVASEDNSTTRDPKTPKPQDPANENKVLVKIENLKMHFPVYKGALFRKEVNRVKAVDGLTFDIYEGETLGLVGESGCGKSTTGRAVIQLYEPTDGAVVFEGCDLTKLPPKELHRLRRDLQMIFQDPYASLNPRMTVGDIIAEPMKVHKLASGKDIQREVQELMDIVGLDPRFVRRYPHEFSGGQRQRIGIARALASKPKFIVADEPISALDVSIQAQIMNLMDELQDEFGLTYLFIAHDLAAVRHISDRIAVMYLGNMAELCDGEELYENPLHPYTEALISAVPIPDPEVEETRERIVLQGDVPSPLNPPSGCVFHTRCPYAFDRCKKEKPVFQEAEDGHFVACHLIDEPERRENVDPTKSSPLSSGGE